MPRKSIVGRKCELTKTIGYYLKDDLVKLARICQVGLVHPNGKMKTKPQLYQDIKTKIDSYVDIGVKKIVPPPIIKKKVVKAPVKAPIKAITARASGAPT